MDYNNAADSLVNRTLKTGWKVTEKIEKKEGGTGSFFSVCYKVEKEGEICFLKAFDFARFFQISPDKSFIDVLNDMVNSYKYERDLSFLCRNSHVTKVAIVIDAGEENIPGYSIPTVPYLIFDLADGDVRSKMKFSGDIDFAWKLKSLHNVAVGMKQLHTINISHQDLKPSNILVYDDDVSKIGDLGRSLTKTIDTPLNNLSFSGDKSYAPPEILFRYYNPDWNERVFATDCYMLGSMIVFFFSGVSMNALMTNYLPDMMSWKKWADDFETVKEYLLEAFNKALDEFEKSIKEEEFKADLRWLVERLCYPIPEERGHPKNIIRNGSSYNLERFVAKLDLLHRKAKYKLLK